MPTSATLEQRLLSFAVFIGIFVFHNYIASYEEKLLEAKFGEDYQNYEKSTGKWLPGIGRKR
jgi:protein-S-isoprenylcysteine O-methyltransferase Ste14